MSNILPPRCKASSTKPIAPSPGPQTGCNSPATMIWREISIGKNLVSTIRKKFTNTSTNIDHGRADTRLRNVCLGKVCLLLLSYIFLLHIMFATTWQIVFHKHYYVCHHLTNCVSKTLCLPPPDNPDEKNHPLCPSSPRSGVKAERVTNGFVPEK